MAPPREYSREDMTRAEKIASTKRKNREAERNEGQRLIQEGTQTRKAKEKALQAKVWTNGAQDRDKPKPQANTRRQQHKQTEEHESKQAGEDEGEDDPVSDNRSPTQDDRKKRKKRSSTQADNNSEVEETELSDQPVMKKSKHRTKSNEPSRCRKDDVPTDEDMLEDSDDARPLLPRDEDDGAANGASQKRRSTSRVATELSGTRAKVAAANGSTGSRKSNDLVDSNAPTRSAGRPHHASRTKSTAPEDDGASSDLPDRVFTSQPLPSREKISLPAKSASQLVEYDLTSMTRSSRKTKSSAPAPVKSKSKATKALKTSDTNGSSENTSDDEAGRHSRKGSDEGSSEEPDEDFHNPEIEHPFFPSDNERSDRAASAHQRESSPVDNGDDNDVSMPHYEEIPAKHAKSKKPQPRPSSSPEPPPSQPKSKSRIPSQPQPPQSSPSPPLRHRSKKDVPPPPSSPEQPPSKPKLKRAPPPPSSSPEPPPKPKNKKMPPPPSSSPEPPPKPKAKSKAKPKPAPPVATKSKNKAKELPPSKTKVLPTKASSSKSAPSGSRRLEKAQNERPYIANDDDDEERAYKKKHKTVQAIVWPSNTDLQPPGTTRINLKMQSARVRAMINDALENVVVDCYFEDSYMEQPHKLQYFKALLIEAALQNDDDVLARRIEEDASYFLRLKSQPENRLTTVRGNVKKAVISIVPACYKLKAGVECDRVIQDWIKRRVYVYPGKTPTTITRSLPYQHPAMIRGISAAFFTGSKSYVERYLNKLEVKRGHETRYQCLPSMLALVATAIESVLLDWQGGSYECSDFVATKAHAVYISHIQNIQKIERDNLAGYRQMLRNLFTAASNGKVYTIASASAADMAEVIDLDGMPVDSDVYNDLDEEGDA